MNEMYASLFFSSQLGNDSLCNSSCRRSACLSKASLTVTVTCFSKLHMWWEIAVSILLCIFQARFLDTVVMFMIERYSTLSSHYRISYDDRIFFFLSFF